MIKKINRPKSANIIWVKPTEEKRKRILDIIESMMMEQINQKSEEEKNGKK
ncbi:hypothetical protein M3690_04365 [Priestia megaterium]|uniref:hypothetical protein n=1 Tax=Priestia megaterium TaxID=1404 RepID=UPI00203E8804|nr:hypothetical protein [Priestia megaterium]MCM3792526.1 hypothetical protein [Priestia megaterium]